MKKSRTFLVTLSVTVDAEGSWRDPATGKLTRLPVTARDVAEAAAREWIVDCDAFAARISGPPVVTEAAAAPRAN